MRSKLIITAWLVLTGVIIGAIIGALTMQVLMLIQGGTVHLEAAVAGAGFGAVTGGVLAPIAAWTLMRFVPIGRAIGGTALGTTLGAVVGFSWPLTSRSASCCRSLALSSASLPRPPGSISPTAESE